MDFRTVEYRNGHLTVLDQTRLPMEERYIELKTLEDVRSAIRTLQVRGAPLIGVCAAYGLLLAEGDFREACAYLKSARPTAVNLFKAVERMEAVYDRGGDLEAEADAIYREDVEACRAMGEYGLSLLKPGMGILTHCNAGALATAGIGTCLAPLHLGRERGYDFRVYADETRPLLQGARLTAWELSRDGIDVTVICDNMAASVMKKGLVDAVVVGCDRMAANGDGANKIGTSGLGILAKEYGIPMYFFVPVSTIDPRTDSGDGIVIEERDGDEIVRMWYERPMAPEGVKTLNPAFDVTDHKYISAVVTEKGIIYPPYTEGLKRITSELQD